MKLLEILDLTATILAIYCLLNFVPMILGIADGLNPLYGRCNEPTSRIGYVMVGYRAGCWLGAPY